MALSLSIEKVIPIPVDVTPFGNLACKSCANPGPIRGQKMEAPFLPQKEAADERLQGFLVGL